MVSGGFVSLQSNFENKAENISRDARILLEQSTYVNIGLHRHLNALDNGDDFEDVYEDDDEFKKTIFG